MLFLPHRTLFVACFIALFFGTAGCSRETSSEMLERAVSDTSMTDEEAIELIAKATFDSPEVTTETNDEGKVLSTLSIHGEDESGLPPSVIDTAEGGINNAMKLIQLTMFIRDFARFIENGRQRNLGEVVLTIKTATIAEGQVQDWVDTYRLRLPADRFDDIARLEEGDLEKRVAVAEKTWVVEFDGFDQFTYQK